MPCYRLMLVYEGEYVVNSQKSRSSASVGSLIMIPPNKIVNFVGSMNAKSATLYFRTLLFGTIDLTHVLAPVSIYRPSPDIWKTLQVFFGILLEHTERKTTAAGLITDGLTRTILGICWEPLGLSDLYRVGARELPDWLALVLQEIQHYPMLSVNELATMAGYSRTRFRQLFHQYIGMSPSNYLLRRRFELAQRMLTSTEMPINRIAESLGFASHSNFTRFFIQETGGISPGKFRQANPHFNFMEPSVESPANTPAVAQEHD